MNKSVETKISVSEKFKLFLAKTPKWLKVSNSSKVDNGFEYNVIYSATRYVRNFKGFIFPDKIEKQTLHSIETRVDKQLKKSGVFEDFIKIKVDSLTDSEIKVLSEKRVIPHLKIQERKNVRLYIYKDEETFIILNYRDHLSVFSFEKGFNVKKSFSSTKKILNVFDDSYFSKDESGNYLTSDINFYGSGFKVFILTTLSYLKFRNNLKKVTSNLKKNGLVHFKHFNFSKKREDIIAITNSDSFSLSESQVVDKFSALSKELQSLEYKAKDATLNSIQSDTVLVAEFLKNKLNTMVNEEEISLKQFVKILDYMILFNDILTKNIEEDFEKEKVYKKIITKLISGLTLFQVGHLSIVEKNSLSIREGDLKRAIEIKKVFKQF